MQNCPPLSFSFLLPLLPKIEDPIQNVVHYWSARSGEKICKSLSGNSADESDNRDNYVAPSRD